MNKCLDCHAVFEVPKPVAEDTGEVLHICPCCPDGDFEEAFICKRCGEYFTDGELIEGFCEECKNEVNFQFKALIINFTDEEKKLLNCLYEGEEF